MNSKTSSDDSRQFLHVFLPCEVAFMSQNCIILEWEAELVADEQAPGEHW